MRCQASTLTFATFRPSPAQARTLARGRVGHGGLGPAPEHNARKASGTGGGWIRVPSCICPGGALVLAVVDSMIQTRGPSFEKVYLQTIKYGGKVTF